MTKPHPSVACRPGLWPTVWATRLPSRLLAGALFVGFGCQATAPTVAHGQAGPSADAPRKRDDIDKDIKETQAALGEAMPEMAALLDPSKRADLKPKVVPVMRKMSNLFGELATVAPEVSRQLTGAQMELRAMMALLGDQQAGDELARLTVSNDPKEASDAKSWTLLNRWVAVRTQASEQEKLAGEFTALAKTQPANGMIAQAASLMIESAATPALGEQIEKTVADELRSEQAMELTQTLAAKRRFKALEGKPFVIEGPTLDGAKFSTAGWKGKVVLVDFWATWCPLCMAEFPSVKKTYAQYRGKGLEIVGVCWDRKPEDAKAFLAKNADATWPQLYNLASPDRPLLREQFGIESLPVMFLIDRKGIVRSVNGFANYKELIPKLLAEQE